MDQNALVKALQSVTIRAAALDVTHPLRMTLMNAIKTQPRSKKSYWLSNYTHLSCEV